MKCELRFGAGGCEICGLMSLPLTLIPNLVFAFTFIFCTPFCHTGSAHKLLLMHLHGLCTVDPWSVHRHRKEAAVNLSENSCPDSKVGSEVSGFQKVGPVSFVRSG